VINQLPLIGSCYFPPNINCVIGTIITISFQKKIMRILFFVFAVVFIAACNNNTTSTEESTDSTVIQNNGNDQPVSSETSGKNSSANVSGCYWKILKRDTLAISLEQTDNSVTGKLNFNNFEKDASSGLVHGIVEGDIIKLWYNFASEGMNSVMEIYFKKQGDQLFRGIGPVDAKGDTSYYTNHSDITYSQDQSFTKLACEELPGKYK
jgi:hypothetical protein